MCSASAWPRHTDDLGRSVWSGEGLPRRNALTDPQVRDLDLLQQLDVTRAGKESAAYVSGQLTAKGKTQFGPPNGGPGGGRAASNLAWSVLLVARPTSLLRTCAET
jgi:hypothetical protein